MSAHHEATKRAIEATRNRTVPGAVNALAGAAIVWGLAATGYGLFAGHRLWTLGALIVGIVYGLSLAQGALMLSVILSGTQARWGRGLKRIAEAFGLFVPVGWALMTLFLLIGLDAYPWNPATINGDPVSLTPHGQGAPHAKEVWLTPGFFAIRLIAAVGFLAAIDLIYLRASLAPDLLAARKQLGTQGPGWWSFFIGGQTDVNAAAERAAKVQGQMVPLMGFSYAMVMSLIACDLIMSLDPWWFSNMFGGWTFMSALWGGLALLAVFQAFARDWLSLGDFVTTKTTHDLGRFMLAGTMFWAYTLYAQILPIWYANMPEETGFLMVRMMLPQWMPMAKTVAVLCFLAPFTILLSRGLKKMRWPFAAVASITLLGIFLERSLLVMPSVWMEPTVPWGLFAFVNLGIGAGVFGGLVLVATRVLASMPAVPVADPLLEAHPWDVHVHGLDAHAHH